jgi:integral membrane protein (TIGR01906 family)
MKLLTITKYLLILMLPFIVFLSVFNIAGFSGGFYENKFSEYKVYENVEDAKSLHSKVIDFLKGKSDELPNDFNKREKDHLIDVKNTIKLSSAILYLLIFAFILALLFLVFNLKINNYMMAFLGKILVFGGILTITLAGIVFFFLNSDFDSTFESMHKALFEKGSYTFDPSKEVIVNLYPGQLFMDLGLRISIFVIIAAILVIMAGAYFLLRSKKSIKL